MAGRMIGLSLVAIGAVGLTVTVLDWIGTHECLLESQDLLVLCSSPLPAYLFGVWFALGLLGAFLIARR